MTIAKVQGVNSNGVNPALTSVAAGNLLTLQSSCYRSTGTQVAEATPTDTQGTWSVAVASVPATAGDATDDCVAACFYQGNVAAGTHTLTPENNPSKNRTLTEWSGAATASPFDVGTSSKSQRIDITSQVTGTTSATAQADELSLITLALSANGGVADVVYTDPVSGYTTLQVIPNNATNIATFHAYKILTATGTQAATFNWTQHESNMSAQGVIATFKDGGAQNQLAWITA